MMPQMPGAFTSERPLRIAVLISGAGSTLANLLARIADGRLSNVRVVQVISSRRTAGGLEIARHAGVPVTVIRPRDFPEPAEFASAMEAALDRGRADLLVMGGYLCRLPIPAAYRGRILNIHPALLPKYGGCGMFGKAVHAAVLAAGEQETGSTVHVADEEYDHGPILAQALTPVLPGDTPESLSKRVQSLEHELYPAVIQRIADEGLESLDRPERWRGADRPADRS